MFITFEGIDGSGKSTHIKAVAAHLRAHGQNVLVTREPGGTDIGEQIREVLLSSKNKAMSPRAELLLFSASRAQIVDEVLRPHLHDGGIILCDRFYDSTLAYQGFGHGLNFDLLRDITMFATGGLSPDLTVYLHVSAALALRRRREASLFGEEFDRLDGAEAAFRQRVLEGYEAVIEADPDRFVRVDASGSLDDVQAAVMRVVSAAVGVPA